MQTDHPALNKATLGSLCHAIEGLAATIGREAVVFGLFQHGPYFAPMLARYERLAARGATVVVAHVGDGPASTGIHRVTLAPADPLACEWSLVLVSPMLGAYAVGTDLDEFDPTAPDLESGRRFATSWGFDRFTAAEHAGRLVRELSLAATPAVSPALSPVVRSRIDEAVGTALGSPPTLAELALGEAAAELVWQIGRHTRRVESLREELAAESELATRDHLTGLSNREGLDRWLGGRNTDGLDMPAIGMIMIDLDEFKQVNDAHGHEVGDEVLRSVGETLRAVTRPGDVVVRWGGDEFLVLCPGLDDDGLAHMATRLVRAIGRSGTDGVIPSASAGIQVCSSRPLGLDDVDAALYQAKRLGGGQVLAAPQH